MKMTDTTVMSVYLGNGVPMVSLATLTPAPVEPEATYTSLTPEQEELINGRYMPSEEDRAYYLGCQQDKAWRPYCDNPMHEKHSVVMLKYPYGYRCFVCNRAVNKDMSPRD